MRSIDAFDVSQRFYDFPVRRRFVMFLRMLFYSISAHICRWCVLCVSTVTVFGFGGCATPALFLEPIIYAERGGMSPTQQSFFFQNSVEVPLREELAGKKPWMYTTWQEYWQYRYDLLRAVIIRGDPTAQQKIEYIHTQRHLYHLPLYDNSKPPSKAKIGL